MASVTITTTSAEDARIIAAFGKYLNLGRNATAAEVKAAVASFVKTVVREYEERAAAVSAQSGIVPIAPT